MIKMTEILPEQGICDMLTHMLAHPQGIEKEEFQEPLVHLESRPIDRNIEMLKKCDFINEFNDNDKVLFKLSSKGINVAKCIEEIKKLFSES
jgi:hypothetical protein